MPAPDKSTQRTQALALLRRRGMTRLAEFSAAGITATTVSRMERAGEVVRGQPKRDERARGVLCQTAVAHLVEAPQALDDTEYVLDGMRSPASTRWS